MSETERAEVVEARVQYLDEEALRLQRTIDEARKQRDDWHDEAGRQRDRAEKAEAALAAQRQEHRAAYLVVMEERDDARNRLRAETAVAKELLQRNVELGTRADNAEAALAELRERLGNAEVAWAARWREPNGEEIYRSSNTEADARHFVRLWRERGLPGYVTGLEVVSALIGEWQNAETPRTTPERAADEQGEREGGGA